MEMKIRKNKNQKIVRVLQDFDFAKVEAHMAAVGWVWGARGTPTQNELADAASDLLNRVADMKPGYATETGGFRAERLKGKHLRLSFVVESSDTWD